MEGLGTRDTVIHLLCELPCDAQKNRRTGYRLGRFSKVVQS